MTNHCGTCTMCCKLLGISEINKPKGKWCPSCDVGVGCKIYENRPESCKTFQCVWLQSQSQEDCEMPLHVRPDKSKVVIYTGAADAEGDTIMAHVDPNSPNAWRQEPIRGYLSMLSRGMKVVVTTSTHYWLIQNSRAREITMTEADAEGRQYFTGYVRPL